MKLLGGLLILCAAAECVIRERQQAARKRRLLGELLCALGDMESAVRFRRLSMPRILKEQAERPACGAYFEKTLEYLESGTTLQNAWESAFGELPGLRARETLTRLELSGDEQRVTENLHLCQERLGQVLAETERRDRDRSRVLAACALSGGGMLVILLL